MSELAGLIAGLVLLPMMAVAGLGVMFVLFALPLVPLVLMGFGCERGDLHPVSTSATPGV